VAPANRSRAGRLTLRSYPHGADRFYTECRPRRTRTLACHYPHAILIWAAAMGVVVCIGVYSFSDGTRRTVPTASQIHIWRTRLIISAGISGCGWGAAAVFLFPTTRQCTRYLSRLYSGAWRSAPRATLSARFRGVLGISFSRGDSNHAPDVFCKEIRCAAAMALMLASCTVVFINSARQMHRSITESIRLRFENLDLVRNLSTAKEQTEEVNRALQSEIIERKRAENPHHGLAPRKGKCCFRKSTIGQE